jgi:hypothetical protein
MLMEAALTKKQTGDACRAYTSLARLGMSRGTRARAGFFRAIQYSPRRLEPMIDLH